ncbi:uncharacterized protein ACBR49_012149 [Aulostomus maculatus]
MPMKVAVNTNLLASNTPPGTKQAQKCAVQSSAGKWKSSFKPLGAECPAGFMDSWDESANDPERAELYDPFDPSLSAPEAETPQGPNLNYSSPDQDNNLGQKRLGRWDMPYSEPGSRPLDRHDLSPEIRPAESRGLSPGHRLPERQVYSSDTEPLDPPWYGSISRPLDHRSCSPDRLIRSSSTQQIPTCFGVQRTDGERTLMLDYRSKVATSVRSSPPGSQQVYQRQHVKTGLDSSTPSTEVTRSRRRSIILNETPITCDLCDIEFTNGQELEDHLESKSHWDTLEHVQQQTSYDDLAIAFLQEVMLYKSLKCSRAIDDSALRALQENDHMTKVAMFHCAACQVFVSTSASSVQNHITSQEHLCNTKEFEVRQRRVCLDRADTVMKELKPQFEHFYKGGNPFE